MREAKANVEAGREDLRAVETEVLLDAATAYVDVYRDQRTVQLRQRNVEFLTRAVRGVRRQRALEEATRTELAQSVARRARARATLAVARGQLHESRALFKQVVGRTPGRLGRPGIPTNLVPASLSDALSVAASQSPRLLAATHRNAAAAYATDKVRGELLPTIDVEASHSQRYDTSPDNSYGQTSTVTGRLRVPLYQGGEVWARVRQSLHENERTRQEIQVAREAVSASIVAAWARLVAGRVQLAATREQVAASRTALDGAKAEYGEGQIRLLEVLDAYRDLDDSEVGFVQARRDLIQVSFQLLASSGQLQIENLRPGVQTYDPLEHYESVRRKWFGITIRYADGRVERMHAEPE